MLSPSQQLTTALLKTYLQQSLLPGIAHPTIKKKLQGKKHSLKRQIKHQKKTWQERWNYQSRNLKQLSLLC